MHDKTVCKAVCDFCRGYCPGESIAISALFNNGSRRNITPNATLYQIQSFTANGKSKTRSIKLTTVSGVIVPPGETGYWDAQLLKVPAVSPSILNCGLIKVDYLVKVSYPVAWFFSRSQMVLQITLQIPGAMNLYADLPIVIGTVPCRRPRPRISSVIVRGLHSETPHLRPPGPPAYQELEEELPCEGKDHWPQTLTSMYS